VKKLISLALLCGLFLAAGVGCGDDKAKKDKDKVPAADSTKKDKDKP